MLYTRPLEFVSYERLLKIFLSCRIKLVDPDKFLSAKVDFRLNAIFAFKRCSLALARMDCILCDKRQYLLIFCF